MVNRLDWDHWSSDQMLSTDPDDPLKRSVLPLLNDGLLDLMDGDTNLMKGVDAIHTPGHTPGHMSLLISSRNERAMLLGDIVGSPMQITKSDYPYMPNSDPEGPKWPGGLNRASVIPSLYDKLGEKCVVPNPFTRNLTPIQYDAEKGGIRWDIVSDLIGILVIENHKNLVSTWKTINKTKDLQKRATAIKILGEMPITEDEAMRLSESEWKRPDFRNRKLKEWAQFSREKFRRAKKASK